MTPRERMLTAYRHGTPDCVPVSPEIWIDTILEVSGRSFLELYGPTADKPGWLSMLETFEYFGADAWIIAGVGESDGQRAMRVSEVRIVDDETIETRTRYHTPHGDVSEVIRATPVYPGGFVEHPIKRFPRDMDAWADYFFADPDTADLGDLNRVLAGVGERGLVTTGVATLFTSFLGALRDGGMVQTIYDLLDESEYCARLHARYIAHSVARTRRVLEQTATCAVFVNSGFSGLPIINTALFRQWELPLLAAVAAVCREFNVPVHLHQHGHVLPLLDDLIAAGVNIVCPLFPPPQGDVHDLADVKQRFGSRIALKGNVDPQVLLQGSAVVVDRAVAGCIRDAAPGGGYILGTADGIYAGTPLHNIHAFVEAGRRYGRCSA